VILELNGLVELHFVQVNLQNKISQINLAYFREELIFELFIHIPKLKQPEQAVNISRLKPLLQVKL